MNYRDLSSAIQLYEKRLRRSLVRPLLTYFDRLYKESTQQIQSEGASRIITKQLKYIPKWNEQQRNLVFQFINESIPEKFRGKQFEDVLKKIFIGNGLLMKLLPSDTVISDEDINSTELNVNVPNPQVFVHQVLISIGIEFLDNECAYEWPSRSELKVYAKNGIDAAITDLLSYQGMHEKTDEPIPLKSSTLDQKPSPLDDVLDNFKETQKKESDVEIDDKEQSAGEVEGSSDEEKEVVVEEDEEEKEEPPVQSSSPTPQQSVLQDLGFTS